MQADRFTVKSQEAVQSALELARSHRNPEAAPAHLLVALLDQPEGLVVPILQRLGADTATIAARASEAVAALPKLGGEAEEPRMSSALAATLRRAEQEMGRLGDSYISTDHFLLALTEDSGWARCSPTATRSTRRSARCARRRSPRRTRRRRRRRWRNSAAT